LRKTVLVLQREARSKDFLCPCVETRSTQKLQCLLALFAGCSLLQTTQEEILSFLCLRVRVLLQRRNSMGMDLFYNPHPFPFFSPLPPPLFITFLSWPFSTIIKLTFCWPCQPRQGYCV
jgi:hypothetical protein